jgi:D-arabinose 1-dehydrogenase-like Zn-dependent alcohol dehydrogenase
MGFRTVAIGRGRDKEKLAKDLGEHLYIDPAVEDAAAVLQRMCRARAILATGTSGDAMGRLVPGLAARGKLIVVGAPADPIQLNAFPLIFGGRSIYGSLTGTPIDCEDTLAFSVLENIRPMIETGPVEQAAVKHSGCGKGRSRSFSLACSLLCWYSVVSEPASLAMLSANRKLLGCWRKIDWIRTKASATCMFVVED